MIHISTLDLYSLNLYHGVDHRHGVKLIMQQVVAETISQVSMYVVMSCHAGQYDVHV